MDIMTKDLNLLRTFLLLAEEKSLSQAADKLHLSQPALSYQLKKMREEFGDLLFIRTRSGYKLTEKASQLFPQVKSILTNVDGLYSKPTFVLEEHRGEFNFAATTYFEAIVMNSLLQRLRKNAPLVRVQTFSLSEKTPQRELEDGTYDLVIAAFFTKMPKSFHTQKLGKDHQVCVMRKNHPCLSQKWDLKKYLEGEHVKIDVPSGSISRIDRYLEGKKLEPRKIVGRFNNFLTPALVVKNSDAFLTCPERLASFYSKQFDLVSRPLPTPKIEIELQMIWHERRDQDPFQAWIRQELKEIFINER
jgi:DNA-binding transcriptional LysR family regulator